VYLGVIMLCAAAVCNPDWAKCFVVSCPHCGGLVPFYAGKELSATGKCRDCGESLLIDWWERLFGSVCEEARAAQPRFPVGLVCGILMLFVTWCVLSSPVERLYLLLLLLDASLVLLVILGFGLNIWYGLRGTRRHRRRRKWPRSNWPLACPRCDRELQMTLVSVTRKCSYCGASVWPYPGCGPICKKAHAKKPQWLEAEL
jgi:hypothetical protein